MGVKSRLQTRRYLCSRIQGRNAVLLLLRSKGRTKASSTDRKKVVVLGSGPNRIGQGIEFDYCCVHGVLAAKECGYETIMINCNPETVSTDFDTADKLYFEPVFLGAHL